MLIKACLTVITLIIAIVLSMVHIPVEFNWLYPQWVTITLILYLFVNSLSLSLILAWSTGILIDLLHNTILGQHAVIFLLIVYFLSYLIPMWRTYNIGRKFIIIFYVCLLELICNYIFNNNWSDILSYNILLLPLNAISSSVIWIFLFNIFIKGDEHISLPR